MGPGGPPGSQAAPLPSNLPFRVVSKNIGTGAYAIIRKAIPLHAAKPVIAIKFINKQHAFKQGRLTPTQLKREITLHEHLSRGCHQNIIRLLTWGEDPNWNWLAMELADGGDLFDKIEPDMGVGEDIAHFYFTQLMNAVAFMHSKGVAHRDLKPENVLLSANGDLKLADFGLAALFEKDGQTRLCNTVCGSPPYIAPEVVQGKRSQRIDVLDVGYAANICDIWSCGVVLFVLLLGNTPWDEPTLESEEFVEYMETKGHPNDELWAQLPQDILSLLLGMMELDPRQRYTIADIQSHPWFQRPNKYLSPSGRNANPIGLAAEMLSQLRIDFSKPPSQTQRSVPSQDVDAMDIDCSPQYTRPENINDITTSVPITPLTDDAAPFDWERPSTFATFDPSTMPPPRLPASSFFQLPPSTQDALSQDPAMSQFTPTPRTQEDLITLTQAARQFRDVLPPSSFSRFLSPLSISVLVPLVVDALTRLGIPADMPDRLLIEKWEARGEASVKVKMADPRRQALSGNVVVERVVLDGGVGSCEVRFVKGVGDPLEWRRFFRNVVVGMGERVVMRPGR